MQSVSNGIQTFQRLWKEKYSRLFWVLADQGVVSMGTFLTSILLARTLLPAEYGVFALLVTLINFLNNLHSALVIIPISTRGAQIRSRELQHMAYGSLVMTFIMILPLGAILGGAAWFAGRPGVALSSIFALLFWQVQETLRRAFMAKMRYREAFWGDLLRYFGQAALVYLCIHYLNFFKTLGLVSEITVELAFWMIALCSFAAAVVQFRQHGVRKVIRPELYDQVSSFWGIGRWILVTNILGLFLSQAYPWTLALYYGKEANAEFQALANILGIAHPVFFSISSLIYPAVSKAKTEAGEAEAKKIGFRFGAHGGLLLAPFYFLLLAWPVFTLRLFYGESSPYLNLQGNLRLFVLYYIVNYISYFMIAVLNSLERTRAAFTAQLISALATIVIGLPLIARTGVTGAVMAGGITSLTLLLSCLFFLRRSSRSANAKKMEIALSH
jgi:O-antigen/teichoic acid export membrane protein